MHYGEPLADERFISVIRHAYTQGIRTFLTADVYGSGEADTLLGRALSDFPRESYALVGAVGHDFYKGERQGSKGFPRFTNSELRKPDQFGSYLRMATEKSLERIGADHFDLLLLHNPDRAGYSSDAVWRGMETLKTSRLANRLGIAPGPANGFTLDTILAFERFQGLLDWAMIILNPLEPWPGRLVLPAAEKHGVKIITRVVDYGGVFFDDVKAGHDFVERDHRKFRPDGWIEAGCEKLEKLRPFAEAHSLTMIQLACLWNLAFPAVQSVVPTLIQEKNGRTIESKIDEIAASPEIAISETEREEIAAIGDNRGCMLLKGANPEHVGEPLADRWEPDAEHLAIGERWKIDPAHDLAKTH